MTLADIKKEYEDSNGKQRFIATPHYFEKIPKLYSPIYPKGVKFSPLLQKLFCYLDGWNNGNNQCYESQESLSDVLNASRKTVNEAIATLEGLGLLSKTVLGRGYIYKALPIQEHHLLPPGEQVEIAPQLEESNPPIEEIIIPQEEYTPMQGGDLYLYDGDDLIIPYLAPDKFETNVLQTDETLLGYLKRMKLSNAIDISDHQLEDLEKRFITQYKEKHHQMMEHLKETIPF